MCPSPQFCRLETSPVVRCSSTPTNSCRSSTVYFGRLSFPSFCSDFSLSSDLTSNSLAFEEIFVAFRFEGSQRPFAQPWITTELLASDDIFPPQTRNGPCGFLHMLYGCTRCYLFQEVLLRLPEDGLPCKNHCWSPVGNASIRHCTLNIFPSVASRGASCKMISASRENPSTSFLMRIFQSRLNARHSTSSVFFGNGLRRYVQTLPKSRAQGPCARVILAQPLSTQSPMSHPSPDCRPRTSPAGTAERPGAIFWAIPLLPLQTRVLGSR